MFSARRATYPPHPSAVVPARRLASQQFAPTRPLLSSPCTCSYSPACHPRRAYPERSRMGHLRLPLLKGRSQKPAASLFAIQSPTSGVIYPTAGMPSLTSSAAGNRRDLSLCSYASPPVSTRVSAPPTSHRRRLSKTTGETL